jgi:hypothetical protein
MVAHSRSTKIGSSSGSRIPKVSARGRVCVNDGCSTVLSIYNESPNCSMHERILPKWGTRRS